MTGRIVYTPTPLHDCKPPAADLDLQGRFVGTKWQCDTCWQVWALGSIGAGPIEHKAWRRDGNPHCAVIANAEGDLVALPGRPTPRLPDPYPQKDDFDGKRAALWLIGIVVFAALLTIAALWLDGGFR